MRWIWWGIFVVALLAGCAEQGPRLVVAPDRLELAPGEEQPLQARLDGVEGEVVWSAEHGTIVGSGLEVVYRAPDYPTEDVITVISKDDLRLRAEVRVVVSGSGELGPRIEIAGDQALVFTELGEKRPLRARVYDEAGKLFPDARPTFTSADPASFSIEYDEEGNAFVTALSDKIQSVTLTAAYQGREARAVAVFARLQPGVVRLPEGSFLSGDWQAGGWTSLVLERTPETEALEPGTVFYSGDGEALWGRVDAVELADDTVTLITSPVRLEDIFRDLDYRASTPPLQVKAEWGRGRLRVSAGGQNSSDFADCDGIEADLEGSEELTATAALNLRISDGLLQDGELLVDLEDAFSSTASLRLLGEKVGCNLAGWQVRVGRLSLLVARLDVLLDSSLGVFAEGGEAELTLPAVGLETKTSAVLKYKNGAWQPSSRTEQQARPPQAAPVVNGTASDVQAGLSQRLEASFRLLLPGEDAELARLTSVTSLPWKIRLDGSADPDDASYSGATWELEKRLETSDGEHDSVSEEELAHSPRVWLEADPSQVRQLDLGSLAADQALRFSFGTLQPTDGEAEVWTNGGACTDAACFEEPLHLLGQAELPDGQVVWRPSKDERGVYQAYARLRADDFSQSYPYAAGPQLVVVSGPDLSELPLELTLFGERGGAAVGVISYLNRPLWGVTPAGKPIQLTSPLQVWIPANGLIAEPASLTIPAGRWGYQEVAYRCPRSGKPSMQELHLFSNDPEMAEVVIPLRILCDARRPPQPLLAADKTAGAAPMRVRLALGAGDAAAGLWCRLDFGDGSQPLEWSLGECPRKTVVEHVYDAPGNYTVTLLLGTAEGVRAISQLQLEAR
ncbi:hypothetical protein [Oceanithermus sp.]